MGAQYQAIFRDTSGAKQYTVTDFQSLSYAKKRNLGGSWSIEVNGDHPIVGNVADKWLIEIRRRVPEWGFDWYTDFYGVLRDEDLDRPGRLNQFTVSGHGQLNVLNWRHVLWYAGTADRSTFTSDPAETVLKTLVTYNATSSATIGAGRRRTGAITNFVIAVEADGAAGNVISSYSCAWDNLLEALYAIGQVAGGDYDLIYNSTTHQWEFRWYTGQQGDDRRATVRFTINFDNMASPRYVALRSQEKTAAIVLGKGEEDYRSYDIVTGDNYSAANDIEVVIGATDLDTSSGRQTRGNQRLQTMKARESFSFRPEQVAAFAYGKHYCVDGEMGDLVSARWGNISGDYQIEEVTVTVAKATAGDIETVYLGVEEY